MISTSLVPTRTASPTSLPNSARASDDTCEIVPFDGSASSEKTKPIRQTERFRTCRRLRGRCSARTSAMRYASGRVTWKSSRSDDLQTLALLVRVLVREKSLTKLGTIRYVAYYFGYGPN